MENRSKILIVDDNNETIRVLLEILKRDYQLNATTSGIKALEIAKKWDPDVILLDVVMPEIDGYDVCMRLLSDDYTKDIPVIFITAISSHEEEIACIKVGGLDYITKPIEPNILKAKIKNYAAIKRDRRLLTKIKESKKEEVDSSVNDLLYLSLAANEFRDNELGRWHIRRCVEFAKIMIKELMENPKYSDLFSQNLSGAICRSVPYHDIGKSLLSDEILLKPDKLTTEEFEIVKTHVTKGCDLLENIDDEDAVFAQTVKDMIMYHHERWDGTGYPDGLAGEAIPLAAAIMSLVDLYDTLTSDRIYKKRSSHFEAVRIIVSEAGKGFDPYLVKVFLNVHEQFLEAVHKYTDSNHEANMLKSLVANE